MQSRDVIIQDICFENMGRTDKSVQSRDVGSRGAPQSCEATGAEYCLCDHDGDGLADCVHPAVNIKGRYPIHIHRAGMGKAAVVDGCAVWTSPGHGMVHHDSHASFAGNVIYGAHGAGMVAESGNETGAWFDNAVIFCKGNSWSTAKDGVSVEDHNHFDMGRNGEAYWFQGRMVHAVGNIAASVNTGYAFIHRGHFGDGNFHKVDAADYPFPEALRLNPEATPDDANILRFEDNEVFACNWGLQVVKSNPHQGHDVHSHLKGFTAWSTRHGFDIQYTAHYTFENFRMVAKAPAQFSLPKVGAQVASNTMDITLLNVHADSVLDVVQPVSSTDSVNAVAYFISIGPVPFRGFAALLGCPLALPDETKRQDGEDNPCRTSHPPSNP